MSRFVYSLSMMAILLSGCATQEANKAETGAVIGAIVGGIIGNKVAKDKPGLGTALGAAIGGGLGYYIGRELDAQDQRALEEKVAEVAARGETGKSQGWVSDHSGASAVVTPTGPASTRERRVVVKKDARVVVYPRPLLYADGIYRATTGVNIRRGPGVEYPVKGALGAGEAISVVGMTSEGWYLIEQGGVAVGYVSGKYLSRIGEDSRTAAAGISTNGERSARSGAVKYEAPAKKDAYVQEADIRLLKTCRPVTIMVKTAEGRTVEEKTETCRSADGSWGA
jgi:uncharacterized protein YgiM (DUF1202 family)